MELQHFHNLHHGETCLLVGNGPNLPLTPPERFGFPSFGVNTIHLYPEGWEPTYYATVDQRVRREFGEAVYGRFRGIPKFVPTPNLDGWEGDNFVRWLHRPGQMFPLNPERGMAYTNIMHVAMQLAFYMGFTTMLMIGVQHKPAKAQLHFWGTDHNMPAWAYPDWFTDYALLVQEFAKAGVKVLNISEDTYVEDSIIPRGNWRDWITEHESQATAILPGR